MAVLEDMEAFAFYLCCVLLPLVAVAGYFTMLLLRETQARHTISTATTFGSCFLSVYVGLRPPVHITGCLHSELYVVLWSSPYP
jgi:hypothetical protein